MAHADKMHHHKVAYEPDDKPARITKTRNQRIIRKRKANPDSRAESPAPALVSTCCRL